MFRKIGAFLAALALVLAMSGLATATSTPSPFAGRPLRGDNTGNQCSVTAMARVGGNIVLLAAAHCFGDKSCVHVGNCVEGDPIYGSGGVQIGTVGVVSTTWTNNDLQYVNLLAAQIPASNRNLVFHGNGNWTITRSPTSADGCSSFPGSISIVHDAQDDWTSTIASQTDNTVRNVAAGGSCIVETLIRQSASGVVDSGSPFLRSGDTTKVIGVGTSKSQICIGTCYYGLNFTPLYYGLNAMNTYFVAHGGTGAWLCQTSAC